MSKATPTSRSLEYLRRQGYLAEVVEKRLPRCFITRDLFGCIDILAVKPGEPPLGVQTTSASNAAARVHKAIAVEALRTWLAAGCRFEVHGWAKRGKAGERKLWDVRRVAITAVDLDAPPPDGSGSDAPPHLPPDAAVS